FKETLDNLSSQYAEREDRVAAVMAEQMNSKLSEVEAAYGTTIGELKSMIEKLNVQMSSERAQHQNDMKEMRSFYDQQFNQTRQAYENAARNSGGGRRDPVIRFHVKFNGYPTDNRI
ncbi:5987_t:CDS:2, partial [Racocetra fulgida]